MEIIVITPEQLKQIILDCLSAILVKDEKTITEPSKYLHSIKDLSEFLGCSKATAHKIKKSGILRYSQIGRKILFNTREIMEDLTTRQIQIKRQENENQIPYGSKRKKNNSRELSKGMDTKCTFSRGIE